MPAPHRHTGRRLCLTLLLRSAIAVLEAVQPEGPRSHVPTVQAPACACARGMYTRTETLGYTGNLSQVSHHDMIIHVPRGKLSCCLGRLVLGAMTAGFPGN